jgi:hypothetical protein
LSCNRARAVIRFTVGFQLGSPLRYKARTSRVSEKTLKMGSSVRSARRARSFLRIKEWSKQSVIIYWAKSYTNNEVVIRTLVEGECARWHEHGLFLHPNNCRSFPVIQIIWNKTRQK